MCEPNLKELFDTVGGIGWISKMTGVKYMSVYNWAVKNKIPAERAVLIEEKTNALLTRYQLRPDLFGEGPKKK